MPPRRGGGRGRGGGPAPEVSKEEYAVAKFMRSNVPTKTTTLCGMKVDYFVGSKAIDALLASHVSLSTNCVLADYNFKYSETVFYLLFSFPFFVAVGREVQEERVETV